MMDQSELLELVAEGKDAWNEWARANPESKVDFSNMNFVDDVDFTEFRFPRTAHFTGAIFTGDAGFTGAIFTGDAGFNEATFKGDASFIGATFTDETWFRQATFTGTALFREVTFTGSNAWFREATFTVNADFRNATFTGYVDFSEATFTGIAQFGEATSTGGASFTGATFTENADFSKATFNGAEFRKAHFTEYADFGDVRFGGATFTGATFIGDAWFGGATFTGDARFGGATFTGSTRFNRATFSGYSLFVSINVESRIEFEDTEFHQIPDFSAAKNPERISLDTIEFVLPGPSGRFYGFVYWATGLYGSDRSTMIRIRQIRGIANKNHAVDTERDLTILERNAQVGAAWATVVTRRTITDKNDAIDTEADPTPIERNTQIGAIPELWKESKPLRQWLVHLISTIIETFLLLAYRWSSRYGRSVVRPVLWLVVSFCSYRWLYGYLYDNVRSDYQKAKNVSDSLLDFTITSMVPFGSNVRPTYQIAVNNLFRPIEQTMSSGQTLLEGRVPAMFQLVSLSQGVLTLTFVFLIGLALRNFFRMK